MKTNSMRTLFNTTCVILSVAVMASGCLFRNRTYSQLNDGVSDYRKKEVRIAHQKDDYRCNKCDERELCPCCGRTMHEIPAFDALMFECPRCGHVEVLSLDWFTEKEQYWKEERDRTRNWLNDDEGDYRKEEIRIAHQKSDYRCNKCDERELCPCCGRTMHEIPAFDALMFECPRCGVVEKLPKNWLKIRERHWKRNRDSATRNQ